MAPHQLLMALMTEPAKLLTALPSVPWLPTIQLWLISAVGAAWLLFCEMAPPTFAVLVNRRLLFMLRLLLTSAMPPPIFSLASFLRMVLL